MAENPGFQSFMNSQLPLNWNFDDLRKADQDMFDDDESELSDMSSSVSSMDIDMDAFGSDRISHLDPGRDRFPLLPLEVRYPRGQHRLAFLAAYRLQMIEMIANHIADDADLMNFILTCKDFALAVVLEKSTVWRTRFLARYDHPIIEGPYEFRIAYQLREMVLRKFPSFAGGGKARNKVALEVLRDMILGTSDPFQ